LKRSLVYIILLSIIAFIPFEYSKEQEAKSLQPSKKSINIKIVTPQIEQKKEPVKKVQKPKLKKIEKPKPKPKPIEKKIVKKVQKPKPKEIVKPVVEKVPVKEMIEKKEEIIEEEIVEEDLIEEVVQEPQESTDLNRQNEIDAYFAQVYEIINKAKYYPKKSRRFKQEDSIPVSFLVDKDGLISNFNIVKPSKYRELNKAVQKMFQKIKRFDKPPKGALTPLEMKISINFKL